MKRKVITIISLLTLITSVSCRPVELTDDVVDKVYNAEKAVYTYEYFKNQIHDIKALREKEIIAENAVADFFEIYGDNPDNWDRQDKTELSRLKTNLTGVQNVLEDAIADYNAKSEMTHKSIFKDELPTNLIRSTIDLYELKVD